MVWGFLALKLEIGTYDVHSGWARLKLVGDEFASWYWLALKARFNASVDRLIFH